MSKVQTFLNQVIDLAQENAPLVEAQALVDAIKCQCATPEFADQWGEVRDKLQGRVQAFAKSDGVGPGVSDYLEQVSDMLRPTLHNS